MTHIEIYQLNDEQIRYFGFKSFRLGKQLNGREVTKEDYNLVYEANLPIVADGSLNFLDEIFTMFNLDHPKDFRGHSLSVSDVVRVGNGAYWFCDDFGWYLLDW